MAAADPVANVAGSCASCGAAFGAPPRKGSVGEPLRQCPSCGRVVLRDGVNEWDLLPVSRRAGLVAHHALIAFAVGRCGPVVGWVVARELGRPWGGWDAMLAVAVGLALGRAVRQGFRLSGTIRRSRSRMADPMYVARLIEHQLAARR